MTTLLFWVQTKYFLKAMRPAGKYEITKIYKFVYLHRKYTFHLIMYIFCMYLIARHQLWRDGTLDDRFYELFTLHQIDMCVAPYAILILTVYTFTAAGFFLLYLVFLPPTKIT